MNKRLVLAACFITVFVAYAVRYGYGILLPEMLDSLGITKTDAGVIFSAFFVAYTIASPVCGYISDRYGSRWMLASFVILLGVGALLMSYASTILQATLFFTLAGIGSAACWAPVMALAQKWTSHENRGKTLSYIDVGSALSIIAMGILVPIIIRDWDWRAGWVILGTLGIAVGIFNFLVIKNPPDEKPDKNSTTMKTTGVPLSALLRSGKFWLFGLGYLFTGFSILVPFTFLSTYAVQELNFSYSIAAYLMTAIGVGAIVSKIVIGPLSDKTGRLKMIFLCGALICLGCLGMVLSNVVTLFIAAFIFALGYGAVWAMYAAAASDYFLKESSGTIIGIWTLFLGVGSVLSPIISGWLADATGTLTWSFGVGALGALMSVVLVIPLWSKKRA
jgi:OFA family oxalate/formate antiporter-like MFS transporter